MLKISLECIPCVLRASTIAVRQATEDPRQREEIFRRILRSFSEVSWDHIPLKLHQVVRDVIKDATGVVDPYHTLKREYDRKALSLYPDMRKIISESDDPLKTAVKFAALGNMIDFGVYSETILEMLLERASTSELSINDYELFKETLMKAKQLLYFLDNSGEIVFDKVLLESMIDVRGKPFEKITLVCKDSPILNDATIEDVKYVGLDTLPNVELRTITIDLKPASGNESVEDWIKQYDLTIFKGQANFEAFLDLPGVFFLFITKCTKVSEILGVNVGDLVLKYNPRRLPSSKT